SDLAETKKLDADCEVSSRTAVTLTIDEKPEVFDENLQVCPNVPLTLDAGAGNYSYQWASGETGRNLVITEPGNYSVVLTNTQGCAAVKNFRIEPADVVGISGIKSEGNKVIITPENSGSFEYSLNGVDFQQSNIFENV